LGGILKIRGTPLAGLFVVEAVENKDNRGKFTRLFCENELSEIIKTRKIVQINLSHTNEMGTVRGMHYQMPPYSEMKLVRCLKGRIWDVAVDLRYGSTTFLHWYAEELSSTNNRIMVIPEGFAHGFQVLENDSELLYLHTNVYNPASENGVKYDDALIGIPWLLTPKNISKRDNSNAYIDWNFKGIKI
jgi:dTDP-4-dehydrorhamnose 3,5-epimerase